MVIVFVSLSVVCGSNRLACMIWGGGWGWGTGVQFVLGRLSVVVDIWGGRVFCSIAYAGSATSVERWVWEVEGICACS